MRGRDDVTFTWVKGHSGDRMNDAVDLLATRAAATQEAESGEVVDPAALALRGRGRPSPRDGRPGGHRPGDPHRRRPGPGAATSAGPGGGGAPFAGHGMW